MARTPSTPRTRAKPPMGTNLTHVGADGRPRMVDVGAKPATRREAIAEVRVRFPADVAATLRAQDLRSSKGPVLDTAIVAGTMAVKRTHELIPFCHPLPIEHCRFEIAFAGADADELVIRCSVALTHKTGVEMEALTGASIAALTVYDMCKALSHEIVIDGLHLVGKSGGKREIRKGRVIE